ncbi:hypothetical protein AB0C34_14590 [Nocardia sp. NPDC049220]|uniref:hypothetical protein n=1 Tax=Nocardia sp. NPDC049220 TaxID=3155273 RepID=UPI0033F4E2E5
MSGLGRSREAALVVVREGCPDHPFSSLYRVGKSTTTRYACTHLNARAGDCFNNPNNIHAHCFGRERRHARRQVRTRVESHAHEVCYTASNQHHGTSSIVHKQPPVSFYQHHFGT